MYCYCIVVWFQMYCPLQYIEQKFPGNFTPFLLPLPHLYFAYSIEYFLLYYTLFICTQKYIGIPPTCMKVNCFYLRLHVTSIIFIKRVHILKSHWYMLVWPIHFFVEKKILYLAICLINNRLTIPSRE